MERFTASGYETFLGILAAAPRVKQVLVLGSSARRTLEERSGLHFQPKTHFDDLPKVRTFQPVLSVADWKHASGRKLRVVALDPYRNVPHSPLAYSEIDTLPRYL